MLRVQWCDFFLFGGEWVLSEHIQKIQLRQHHTVYYYLYAYNERWQIFACKFLNIMLQNFICEFVGQTRVLQYLCLCEQSASVLYKFTKKKNSFFHVENWQKNFFFMEVLNSYGLIHFAISHMNVGVGVVFK